MNTYHENAESNELDFCKVEDKETGDIVKHIAAYRDFIFVIERRKDENGIFYRIAVNEKIFHDYDEGINDIDEAKRLAGDIFTVPGIEL